jgi:drug/metabolite transporter (DMT)-like permease
MNSPHDAEPAAAASRRRSVGLACGLISAVGYAGANIFLRDVAPDCDPVWVSCMKAVPAALVAWTWVAASPRGRKHLPPRKRFGPMLATALLMQFGGNVAFQWTLGELGLALTVPLVTGSMILASALLGRAWLGESISPRAALAMAMLMVSVWLLSVGSRHASVAAQPAAAPRAASGGAGALPPGEEAMRLPKTAPAVQPPVRRSLWQVAFAVAVACASGASYGAGNVLIRRFVVRDVSPLSTVLVVSTTGVIVLGALSVASVGLGGIAQTPPAAWVSMILAGTCNAAAFLAFTKALQAITVLQVNLLSASQVALCAVAGLVWFSEPLTPWLVSGVALTLAGMALIDRR